VASVALAGENVMPEFETEEQQAVFENAVSEHTTPEHLLRPTSEVAEVSVAQKKKDDAFVEGLYQRLKRKCPECAQDIRKQYPKEK